MQLFTLSLLIITISISLIMCLPILHTYAQDNTNTASVSQSVGELINSVALLVGVVAPLIVSGLAYVKAKSQDPKIKEAADTGIYVGQLATATANKALENKQNIKEMIDFSLKIAPEDAKRILTEKQGLIEKLNKEIQATEAQIKRIAPKIPGEANADTISNLPREKDF
jgi:hypothetical protein